MLSVKVIAALCLLVACQVTAKLDEKAPPKPCCTPPVYEGRVAVIVGEEIRRHSFGVFGNTSFHLDTKNGRFATEQQLYTHGRRFDIKMIESTSDNATYYIIPKYKKCRKFPARPLSNCIPKDAKYLGSHTLGGMGSSLAVDEWAGKAAEISTLYRLAVTKDKCVPVYENTFTRFKRVKVATFNKYFDLKEGIKDPNVFTVPDYCTKEGGLDIMDNLIEPATSHHQAVLSFFH